jgi:hypothetical protein
VARPPDQLSLALYSLRLKGFSDVEPIASATGLAVDEVAAELAEAQGSGLVVRRDGRISGWSLTPDGRTQVLEQVRAELEASGSRAETEQAYRTFLSVNQELLGVCTDWQLRTVDGRQVTNDHSDPDHDQTVVKRLRSVDDAVQPVCEQLTAVLARFHRYGPRFSMAVAQVEAGEFDWFTKPMMDSYHTVWFELHEDLLATLGIERGSEGS